jgi:CRISPR-associated protein Cas1
MPVAYVTEPGAVVNVEGGTLHVRKNGQPLADWKIIHLESLCLFGGTHLTQPALRALLKAGVEIALLAGDHRLLGRVSPVNAKNAALRLAQYRTHEDPQRCLELARTLVAAKIENSRLLLLRSMRNHPETDLRDAAAELDAAARRARAVDELDSLRGLEGHAARTYFGSFGRMCRGSLGFAGRSTRPPRDPVNALLSLGYTFLVNELTSLLGAIGFDPAIGFFHKVAPARPSLALDLAEPVRTGLIDRFVLYFVNNRVFGPADFEERDGGCYLTKTAMRCFIRQYQRLMLRKRRDAASGRRETYHRHLQLQAERFARTLSSEVPPAWFHGDG